MKIQLAHDKWNVCCKKRLDALTILEISPLTTMQLQEEDALMAGKYSEQYTLNTRRHPTSTKDSCNA